MAFCTMHFRAASIEKWCAMNILVPDGGGPHPVLYLLHGLSDDYTIWQRRTSIERHVEGLELMVVMPEAQRSWYANDPRPGGLAYEDHIVQDVVGLIDRTFRTVRDRAGRAIAGLSMGGYGAIMLAMRHPDVFSVACSHSGALAALREVPNGRDDTRDAAAHLPRDRYDAFLLAEKHARCDLPLAIRLDCGRGDFLIDQNRAFHAHLDKLGIEHDYRENDGTHDWAYWDRHVPQTLRFVAQHLRR
jgi:S-formylglutathione hydrolase FrmB